MTISGNFDTYEEEKSAVKHYLDGKGFQESEYQISKFGGDEEKDFTVMSVADITVKFNNHRTLLFEVKREDYDRFKKYGELGIDFISSFLFIDGSSQKTGLKHPNDYKSFIGDVDFSQSRFKWGKLEYSRADVWLFYVKDEKGNYHFCEGYDYMKMYNDSFNFSFPVIK